MPADDRLQSVRIDAAGHHLTSSGGKLSGPSKYAGGALTVLVVLAALSSVLRLCENNGMHATCCISFLGAILATYNPCYG
jgi:hypothetical protein